MLKLVVVKSCESHFTVMWHSLVDRCLYVCIMQFTVLELQALATKTVVDYYDPLQCRYICDTEWKCLYMYVVCCFSVILFVRLQI